jgi:hypothetical protein
MSWKKLADRKLIMFDNLSRDHSFVEMSVDGFGPTMARFHSSPYYYILRANSSSIFLSLHRLFLCIMVSLEYVVYDGFCISFEEKK